MFSLKNVVSFLIFTAIIYTMKLNLNQEKHHQTQRTSAKQKTPQWVIIITHGWMSSCDIQHYSALLQWR